MLVQPHQLFAQALNMQYAIGAFNTSNLELTQAIIAGATAERAPVIVQTSEGAVQYAGLPTITALVRTLAEAAPIPVVLHLDHGKDAALIRNCIEAGYTSVMIDASTDSYEENVRRTREVVEYAHDRGVWVEAELGTILGAEGAKKLAGSATPDNLLTNPAEAKRFVAATGVDALAISVGTIHGAFTGAEYIRFELLSELEQTLPGLPLVVHGASGIAAVHLEKVAQSAVCKINVDTELRLAWEAAVRAYFEHKHEKVDVRDMLGPARDAVQQVVSEKIKLFGSGGKAAPV